ncbi:hypothetical protein AGMMS49975_09230 [Clostridia bacterium]|nr:hypothetical protein AGMMS49975_09230 [Clostridia bacterium]
MDKLQKSAFAFLELLNTRYNITLGRNAKQTDLAIAFAKVDFHHLAGLHKLKDNRISTGNREKIFDNIIHNKITFADISDSKYLDSVLSRLSAAHLLETLLDCNSLVFRYNERINVFSVIQADYFLKSSHEKQDYYIFIDKEEDSDTHFCRSFFPKENKDYTLRQPQYTVIYKEKVNLLTGEKIVQCDKLTPKAQKTTSLEEILANAKTKSDKYNKEREQNKQGKQGDLSKGIKKSDNEIE